MEAQKIVGVCELLDKLSNLDPAKVQQAAKMKHAKLIRTIEPDPELITPMVPDFVSDHLNIKAGGVAIPFDHAYEAWAEEGGAALIGPTGTGKTTIIKAFVDRLNADTLAYNNKVFKSNSAKVLAGVTDKDKYEPYRPIKCLKIVQGGEETRAADLIGETGLSYDDKGNRRIEEMLGAATEAYTEGYPLLMDEGDAIPAGVTAQCHGMFDRNSRKVTVWLNGRKEYHRHPEFGVSFTMNTKGYGENISEYAHAQTQSRALFTRISYMIEVGYMPESAEVKLVTSRVPEVPETAIRKMVQASGRIRSAYVGGAIDLIVSTREVEAWAREVRRALARGRGYSHDRDLWDRYVVPAAGPTLCCKTADVSTAQAVLKELSWR